MGQRYERAKKACETVKEEAAKLSSIAEFERMRAVWNQTAQDLDPGVSVDDLKGSCTKVISLGSGVVVKMTVFRSDQGDDS